PRGRAGRAAGAGDRLWWGRSGSGGRPRGRGRRGHARQPTRSSRRAGPRAARAAVDRLRSARRPRLLAGRQRDPARTGRRRPAVLPERAAAGVDRDRLRLRRPCDAAGRPGPRRRSRCDRRARDPGRPGRGPVRADDRRAARRAARLAAGRLGRAYARAPVAAREPRMMALGRSDAGSTPSSLLDERGRALVERVRTLARERFAARADDYDRRAAFPVQDFEDLLAAGLHAPALPIDEGGLGLGPVRGDAFTLWMITRELARANLALARCWEAHVNAMVLLDAMATAEQRRRFVPGIVERGER